MEANRVVLMKDLSFPLLMDMVRKQSIGQALLEAAFAHADDHPIAWANLPYAVVPAGLLQRDDLHLMVQGRKVPAFDLKWELMHDSILAEQDVIVLKIREMKQSLDAYQPYSPAFDVQDLLVFVRLGLCLAALDASRDHLENRVSGGQKTIQHQMVKGMFSDMLIQLQTVVSWYENTASEQGRSGGHWPHMHQELTQAAANAMKLMGGHGYLLANPCLKLGYASDVLNNILSGYEGEVR